MQEVLKTLEKEIIPDEELSPAVPESDIERIAKKWAAFALKAYNGKLRKKALAISEALMDYEEELTRDM